jgi:uncharacterized protein (DUF4415 family)
LGNGAAGVNGVAFKRGRGESWRRVRGKQKAPTKALISLRVSRDVLGPFRATGGGWQTRMDEA